MISVLIVGNGNVATHLHKAFLEIDSLKVTQINSRQLIDIPKADVTIIAVSDDAIAEVSSKIKNDFVVHTSGSFPLINLKNENRKGVFYMLQTFSKEKKVDFSEVPFCLEVENNGDYQLFVRKLILEPGKNSPGILRFYGQNKYIAASDNLKIIPDGSYSVLSSYI